MVDGGDNNKTAAKLFFMGNDNIHKTATYLCMYGKRGDGGDTIMMVIVGMIMMCKN